LRLPSLRQIVNDAPAIREVALIAPPPGVAQAASPIRAATADDLANAFHRPIVHQLIAR